MRKIIKKIFHNNQPIESGMLKVLGVATVLVSGASLALSNYAATKVDEIETNIRTTVPGMLELYAGKFTSTDKRIQQLEAKHAASIRELQDEIKALKGQLNITTTANTGMPEMAEWEDDLLHHAHIGMILEVGYQMGKLPQFKDSEEVVRAYLCANEESLRKTVASIPDEDRTGNVGTATQELMQILEKCGDGDYTKFDPEFLEQYDKNTMEEAYQKRKQNRSRLVE